MFVWTSWLQKIISSNRCWSEQPSLQQIQAALGRVDKLPPQLKALLNPGTCFRCVPQPRANDWLAQHEEKGQNFACFADRTAETSQKMLTSSHNIMHLVPIGQFSSPPVEALSNFAEAFFSGYRVEILPSIPKEEVSQRNRRGQLHIYEIRDYLANMKPASSFCVMGVTMADLYIDDWDFLFGMGFMSAGVGVFSFSRYFPSSYSQWGGLDDIGQKLLLKRSCKVLAHEAAHILGLLQQLGGI